MVGMMYSNMELRSMILILNILHVRRLQTKIPSEGMISNLEGIKIKNGRLWCT